MKKYITILSFLLLVPSIAMSESVKTSEPHGAIKTDKLVESGNIDELMKITDGSWKALQEIPTQKDYNTVPHKAFEMFLKKTGNKEEALLRTYALLIKEHPAKLGESRWDLSTWSK